MPTPIANSNADNFFNASVKTLEYLWNRWQDEKEYEDIQEYALPLKPIAEKHNVTITKMHKAPFGCTFTADGKTYRLDVKARSMGYKRIA